MHHRNRAGLLIKYAGPLALMLSLCGSHCDALAAPPLRGQTPADADQEKKADLTLKVIDRATKKPIRNTAVEIYSDNGIRCIKAPCPTNAVKWAGRTNAHGVVIVPGRVIQRSMSISASGYRAGKDLRRESKKETGRRWIIALDADRRHHG